MRSLGREVLGCDFGGTSWTTKSQADGITEALGLDNGVHLLEIGAGTGWPALYLAGETGCDVSMLDIPVAALKHANQRAVVENIARTCRSIAASGSALPFRSGTFKAIGHSDVLCCLPDKLAMLMECRRVAGENAKMLFFVIAPSDGLTASQLSEAIEAGPPFVGVPDDYPTMLTTANWKLMQKSDLTADYLAALKRLVNGLQSGEEKLRQVLGDEEYTDELQRRRHQISAIERELLVREMYLVKPA